MNGLSHRLLARGVAFVGAGLTVGALFMALGGALPWAWMALAAAVVLVGAWMADTSALLLSMAAVVAVWAFGASEPLTIWGVVGAVGLATMHTAGAVLGVTPRGSRLPRAIAARWLKRWAVMVACAVAMALLAWGFSALSLAALPAITAAAALVVAGGLALALYVGVLRPGRASQD